MTKISCFQNKNILVLGGSFGIGEALVKEFASQGANLIVVARSVDKITEILSVVSGKHIAVECDVTIDDNWKNLITEVEKTFNNIDLIVFSVGTYKPMGLDDFDIKTSLMTIDVNLISFVKFIEYFKPLIKAKKIKHLAVISSIAGYFGMPNSIAYGSSKAGLSNLVESLKYEFFQYDIKVQLINPGFVKSRLTDQNNFSMPFLISAEKAAKIIIKNLRTNKFEIAFPWAFNFIMKFLRFLPFSTRFFIVKYAK
jgi:short-subunit dehydrogenase